MNADDLVLVRSLVQNRSGVVVDATKTYFIETCLAPVARREGFPSISDMIASIRGQRDDRLMWAVTEALTSTETAFFRDISPFSEFREVMLPALAASRAGEPIKVWSAACSTGQEIYSLGMIVDEDRPKLLGAPVELFGSDISAPCLEKAQAGVYNQFEVQRGLPARLLLRYFEQSGEMWRISPEIRQLVRWRRMNLLGGMQAVGRFDVIFCRYVTGLFDEPTRARVLASLASVLADDGYLVLGTNEAASETESLKPVSGRPGVYQRGKASRAVAA
jgi:chemotaxis protein methyltransferase CheR